MKKLVCKSLQVKRSVVYYINKDNKPGRKPTVETVFKNETVTEEKVLTSVKSLLEWSLKQLIHQRCIKSLS